MISNLFSHNKQNKAPHFVSQNKPPTPPKNLFLHNCCCFCFDTSANLKKKKKMVAQAEVLHHHQQQQQKSIPLLDVDYRCITTTDIVSAQTAAAALVSPPSPPSIFSGSDLPLQDSMRRSTDASAPQVCVVEPEPPVQFVPTIRSGSFSEIGHRRYMEDEHIRIDDLSSHLGSVFQWPSPTAFYGVFDGHGGPDAAAFLRKHAMRFFFEDADFPTTFQSHDEFLQQVENSLHKAFLLADDVLADNRTVSSSSGTTVLTALLFGRALLVANVGDCRAVLCRNGEAVEMSMDHRPSRLSERLRVEDSGGFIDDGYLNGILSVTRALGDWDIKSPHGSPSPLIAEPEFKQAVLTEEDEFLVIGCDGIWDVMTSQHAVSFVRRGLRRHDDPEKCARELVLEALRLNTSDNLTVIVVCFSSEQRGSSSPPSQEPQRPKLRCCSLSAEALCNLKTLLNDDNGSSS